MHKNFYDDNFHWPTQSNENPIKLPKPATHMRIFSIFYNFLCRHITKGSLLKAQAFLGNSENLLKAQYGWQSKHLANFGVNLGEIVTGTTFGHKQSESYYDYAGALGARQL